MEPHKEAPIVDESELKMPERSVLIQKESPVLSFVIIMLLVGILLALLGGLYVWSTTLTPAPVIEATRPTDEENNEPESTTIEAAVDTIQVVSTSNELDAIEADLDATFISELDTEYTAIEAELDAASSI